MRHESGHASTIPELYSGGSYDSKIPSFKMAIQEFIDEVGFVLFERKGHESKMDPDGEFKFTMPKNIKIIDKART